MRHGCDSFLHNHGERSDLEASRRRKLSGIRPDTVGVIEQIKHERDKHTGDRGDDDLGDEQHLERAAYTPRDPEGSEGCFRARLWISAHVCGHQVLLDMGRPDEAEESLRGVGHQRNRTLTGDSEHASACDDEQRLNQCSSFESNRDKHGVAKRIKSIALFDRFLIRPQDVFASSKRADQNQ